ncbi:DUF3857 and transglutaminase domain-containing protein [uncultured Winogradskyella sp.]|uniref:DUF3857 and transglutaminase domain-containing protein n=1 Tax=uncultured Winogradskyella sp. TaxID=395353 RepID=UPI0035162124
MKSITSLLIIFFLGFSLTSFSQNYKFGKVSKAEVEEALYPLDSNANAAILYKKEYINFDFIKGEGWQQTRTVHKRIKIYNKEGYKWATHELLLYTGGSGNREKISNIKGYTFTLDQGKLDKTKLRNESIFEEEYSEYRNKTSITMPNVAEGAVIELSYKITSPFLEIDDIVFQYEIPVKELEVNVAIPQFLVYNEYFNPRASFYPNVVREKMKRTYISTNRSRNIDELSANTSYSTNKTDYLDNIMRISEQNVPAIKDEPYIGNINNYKGVLTLELSAFVDDMGVIEKSFSSSWDAVSKTINESRDFGDQLGKNGFFKDDIETLVSEVADPFKKAVMLHAFVKSKVKWNNYNGYSAMRGIRNAYKEGSGNIADINLLLVAMLRSQGVEANPVLISTRDNGIPLFPTRKGFNYVVCMVQHQNQYILLDASEPFTTVNVLPQRALNWKGRLIKSDGTSAWVNLNANEHSTESTMINIELTDNFEAKGSVRQSFSKHIGLKSRNNYANISEADVIKRLERGKGALEVGNVEFKNLKDISKPLRMSYDYNLSDAADQVGDKVYFSPMLFLAMTENPFKLEERFYPIDFIYPYEDKYMVNIKLPEGFEVEYLPESEAAAFNQKDMEFKYIIKNNGAFLQLMVDFKINKTIVGPEDYAVFKSFFSKIVDKQAEQIVLTKKEI